MKFRTEIQIAPFDVRIGYENRLLALGSCFAEHIAGRLSAARFCIATNPTGILFNPLSIADAIRSYAARVPVQRDELHTDGEVWFHYGFHGDFSALTPDEALRRMNAVRQAGADVLSAADRVLVTFGTAWAFERQGAVVANCHKQPAVEFRRRRLGVGEIVDTFAALLAGPLADKQIILSVSPVRHLGDGLEGNSLSKAVLRLAAEELAETHANVHYFPAFEIVNDDLRDYRFYADDLVHPSSQAVAYIWEKFADALLSDETRAVLGEVEAIVAAAAHRPRNPLSEAHRVFCRRQLERIAALRGIDFVAETAYFRRCLEINS